MIHDPRAGLDAPELRRALGWPWTGLSVVEETGSTNADLIGAPPGSVLIAEYQGAGRGRRDRSWASPPRAGLTFSAVVAPPVPSASWGWLPLLTGLAVRTAVSASTGVEVGLKWPNDLLIGEQKVAGILVQTSGSAAVIGVGLNVSTTRDELPVATATSLALAGAERVDRSALLTAILAELGSQYRQWTDGRGDAVATGQAAAYRLGCATIGAQVIVVMETGQRRGTAVAVEDDGRLRVSWDEPGPDGLSEQPIAAGDIVHVRTPGGPRV